MKHMQKLTGILLALMMVLCLAVPAFAVNTDETPNQTEHTITIANATEKDLNKFEAYQIFSGDISDGKLTNITWGSGIDKAQTGALLSALKADTTIGSDMTTAIDNAAANNLTDAEAVAATVATFASNGAKLDAFADVIAKYLSGTKAVNGTDYSKITVTGDGYYLLKNVNITEPGETYTKYILQAFNDVTVTPKRDTITLTKKIVEGSNRVEESNHSIGDTVEFELTTTVPSMDGYNKYYFIIHDTLDKGLTFNNDVEVKIGTQKLAADLVYPEENTVDENHYAVTVDGQSFKIVFHDFLENWKNKAGETITITYSATLNQDANLTSSGNKNTVYLEYSNNPNFDYGGDTDEPGPEDPKGRTPDSVVTVYSTGIQLKKTDEAGKVLTGAKFRIAGEASKVYQINKEIFREDPNANPAYYRLKNGTYTQTAPTTDTRKSYDSDTKYALVNQVVEETKDLSIAKEGWVNSDGIITFTGLGAGTYTITELVAPDGYNLLKSPITVTIVWNGSTAADMWAVTFQAEDLTGEMADVASSFDNTTNCYSANVVNKAGIVMPDTGGAGIIVYYLLGSVLLLGAAALLMTKKRMPTKF